MMFGRAVAAMALGLAAVVQASPSVVKTGVTIYDPARAYNSFVLYAGADGTTHLIDMNGNEIRRWKEVGAPSRMVPPNLTNGARGQIGVQLSTVVSSVGEPAGLSHNRTIGFVDWDDHVLREWGVAAPGGAARQHHAWQRLPGGGLMVQSHGLRTIPGFGNRSMIDNVLLEVDPTDKIVWRWALSDHLDEFGLSPAQVAAMQRTSDADYFHLNDVFVLGPNRWADAGDGRFAPGNLLLVSRGTNVTAIVSRATGHVVWRIGPDFPADDPFGARPVPRAVDQTLGAHNGQMIERGLPGAGHILLFDNQGGGSGYPEMPTPVTGGSRVIEIDPVTKQIVWEYMARFSGRADWTFYSPLASSAERLPNGNTLISEAVHGRFFQVTPTGDIVWEYISPFVGPIPMKPLAGRPAPMSNFTFRIQAVPYDWVPPGTPHSETAVTEPEK